MNLFKSETVRYLIFGVLATAVYAFVKWLTWQAWHSGWGSETAALQVLFLHFLPINFLFSNMNHQTYYVISSILLQDELFFYSYPSLLTGGSLINILIF